MSENPYKRLLRSHFERSDDKLETLRKRRRRTTPVTAQDIVSVALALSDSTSDDDSDQFEDVDIDNEIDSNDVDVISKNVSEGPEEQWRRQNSVEASDVGLELDDDAFDTIYNLNNPTPEPAENITITLLAPQVKTPTKRITTISKDERDFRVQFHQMCLVAMICHGWIRNSWCCNQQLYGQLRRKVPALVMEMLFPPANAGNALKVVPIVQSRKFLDGLKSLMLMYRKKFRVQSKGLVRKNWGELLLERANYELLTFKSFSRMVVKQRGSRDLGAQGFVALLRAIGLEARLVFSIQTPDYASLKVAKPVVKTMSEPDSLISPEKTDNSLPVTNSINSRQRLLQQVRSPTSPEIPTSGTSRNHSKIDAKEDPFEDSDYPIFWIEVWNQYIKKWVAVDPMVLQIIEIPPMRKKSSLEPPASEERNQLTYAISFDSRGKIHDVTRRYSHYFNAKTSKKRISFKDKEWYDRLLKAKAWSSCSKTKYDILELKEFYDRDLCEGIPNNINDFKNHPVYVLESQLRQNEVIYPKDKSTQCGLFRNRSAKSKGNDVIPIYKRSSVHILRSAKAWYMRGRVLKVGMQPLKVREMKSKADSDNEDDDQVRLYGEFQTALYNPPAVVDGKIPKNSFGNIDIYTPTMIPNGASLFQVSPMRPLRMLEKAGRILDVDYAKAITAFDFSGKRTATAREGAVVIPSDFAEGYEAILEALEEEEKQSKRDQVELVALKNWRFFMSKLRIMKRLNKEHGKVGSSEEESEFSVENDSSGSDIEETFEPGGFAPEAGGFEPEAGGFEPEAGGFDPEAGGFEPEAGGFDPEAGGFEPEAGGFEPEAGGFEPEAGGFEPEAGGFDPEAGGFDPEAGGFEPETGGFDPEAGGFEHLQDNHESDDKHPPNSTLQSNSIQYDDLDDSFSDEGPAGNNSLGNYTADGRIQEQYTQQIHPETSTFPSKIGSTLTTTYSATRFVDPDSLDKKLLSNSKSANESSNEEKEASIEILTDEERNEKKKSRGEMYLKDKFQEEDLPDELFRTNSAGEMVFQVGSATSSPGKNPAQKLSQFGSNAEAANAITHDEQPERVKIKVIEVESQEGSDASGSSVEVLVEEDNEFGFDYESE